MRRLRRGQAPLRFSCRSSGSSPSQPEHQTRVHIEAWKESPLLQKPSSPDHGEQLSVPAGHSSPDPGHRSSLALSLGLEPGTQGVSMGAGRGGRLWGRTRARHFWCEVAGKRERERETSGAGVAGRTWKSGRLLWLVVSVMTTCCDPPALAEADHVQLPASGGLLGGVGRGALVPAAPMWGGDWLRGTMCRSRTPHASTAATCQAGPGFADGQTHGRQVGRLTGERGTRIRWRRNTGPRGPRAREPICGLVVS